MKSDGLFNKDGGMDRRDFLKLTATLGGAMLFCGPLGVLAQGKKRISIATGGMGWVYFVMGGGI